jgi:hypothetical protein
MHIFVLSVRRHRSHIGLAAALLAVAAPGTARADEGEVANRLLNAMVHGEHYDTRVDALAGIMAPFGLIGAEAAAHSTGLVLPPLLLEGRAGGAAGGGAVGAWARGKVGLSLRRYHGPTNEEPSERLGMGDVAGVTEHALYVDRKSVV